MSLTSLLIPSLFIIIILIIIIIMIIADEKDLQRS